MWTIATPGVIFLLTWGIMELLFYIFARFYLARRLDRLTLPPQYPIQQEKILLEVLDTIDWLSTQGQYDFWHFLSSWFKGKDYLLIKRDNALDFVAWSLFADVYDKLDQASKERVQSMLSFLEVRYKHEFPEGRANVESMRHTLEPVHFTHRPLAVYFLLSVSRVITSLWLGCHGFRPHKVNGLRYWHRSVAADNGLLPIVFCHGIGIGLSVYIKLIKVMCMNRTALIVESPSISMELDYLWKLKPLDELQYASAIRVIMRKHGIGPSLFVGHSFGSVNCTHMVRHCPDLVAQLGLLDPVCFLLFLPDVAANFLYTDYKKLSAVTALLKKFVAREFGISHSLRRHFWWYRSTLFPHDSKDICCVTGISEFDEITPSMSIKTYLDSWEDHAMRQRRASLDPNLCDIELQSQPIPVPLHSPSPSTAANTPTRQSALFSGETDTFIVDSDREGCELVSTPLVKTKSSGSAAAKKESRMEVVLFEAAEHGRVLMNVPALQDFVLRLDNQASKYHLCSSSDRSLRSLQAIEKGGNEITSCV